MPSLSEALLLVTEGCSALQLDIKNESPQVVEAVARAVVHSHAQAHVLLQFKSIEAARVIKDGFPSLAVLIRVRSKEELLQALELHPEVIELERLAPSKELVSIAHFTGAKVLYNPLGQSADTPATGRSLFDAGVDIVLTERPSAAQEGETKYLDPDP